MQPQDYEKFTILSKAIAKIIKKERKRLNKSQRTLADEYELQKSLISRLENCKSEPKLFNFWKLINALGYNPSEFFILLEKELPKNFTLIDE